MSATVPCTPCCSSTVQTVNVPGSQGNSSVTLTTAPFVIPAVAATVLVLCGDTSWFKANKNVFISDGANNANFLVTAINSATSFTAQYLGMPGDTAAGSTIATGAIVMLGVGNFNVAIDLNTMDALSDLSGGVRASTIASTIGRRVIIIPIQFTDYVNATTLKIAVPFAFTLNTALLRVSKAGTGAGASITLQAQINGVATGGGSIVSTLANSATVGGTVASTAISAPNTGTAGQTLELLVTVGTVFTAGDGWFEFNVTNNDLIAAISEFAYIDELLRQALKHQ